MGLLGNLIKKSSAKGAELVEVPREEKQPNIISRDLSSARQAVGKAASWGQERIKQYNAEAPQRQARHLEELKHKAEAAKYRAQISESNAKSYVAGQKSAGSLFNAQPRQNNYTPAPMQQVRPNYFQNSNPLPNPYARHGFGPAHVDKLRVAQQQVQQVQQQSQERKFHYKPYIRKVYE
jgi:hypothetical protein